MLSGLPVFFYSSAVAVDQVDGPDLLQHSLCLLHQNSIVSFLHLLSCCLIEIVHFLLHN